MIIDKNVSLSFKLPNYTIEFTGKIISSKRIDGHLGNHPLVFYKKD